jgi:hypothetical protein
MMHARKKRQRKLPFFMGIQVERHNTLTSVAAENNDGRI